MDAFQFLQKIFPNPKHQVQVLKLALLIRQAAYTNLRALKNDPVFSLFLGSSLTSMTIVIALQAKALLNQRSKHRNKKQVAGEKKKSKSPKASVDPLFWQHLKYLLRIAIPGPFSREAVLLATQFLLLVMRTLLTVKVVKLNIRFLTVAISKASWEHWTKWVVNFFGWMLMGVSINTGLHYMESSIELAIRTRLTLEAHKKYIAHNNFYRASVMKEGELDNLDQRIVADIAAFSANAAHLYGHSFKPILEFILSLAEAMKELGASRPLLLFAWNFVMGVISRKISPPIGSMIAKEQALEGDFRRLHSRLITHAEEVAFLQGGNTELSILNERFRDNIRNRSTHNIIRIRKTLVDQFLKFQGMLAGGIFIHVPFLIHKEWSESQRISRFRATESLMLKCGEAFVDVMLLHKNLMEISGYTHRIGQLFETLNAPRPVTDTVTLIPDGDSISFKSITISSPEDNQRLLIKDLTLKVASGHNVLITGPNGAGKTSIFRALAGLWAPLNGTMECPTSRLTWLPQKPYLVTGTLRDQVTYPLVSMFNTSNDSRILECLAMAGLASLPLRWPVEGLNKVYDEWNDVLSGGERQRLGFARLYYHHPRFAVLDECTSAINPDEEGKLYEKVVAMGTTVFSIAHRLELRKFHDYELVLAGDGTGNWKLINLTSNTGEHRPPTDDMLGSLEIIKHSNE